LLRMRIETRFAWLSLLDRFHYAYIDISLETIILAQEHPVYSLWGQQSNEETAVVRSTQIARCYQVNDNRRSDYEWHGVYWILA
jgi:hypothetical protein